MKKRNLKISLILNILIVLFTIIASLMMFLGIKPIPGGGPVLEFTTIGMFRLFTVDSNFFMGIISLIFCIDEVKILKDKKRDISKKKYILKLMSTTAVTLTFLVVFGYLGFIYEKGIIGLCQNSNFFFHLLTPILSIITFTCFEKTDKLKLKDTFYGLVPVLIYAIYYISNVLIHLEGNEISHQYDWYWFFRNGITSILIVAPLILSITYLISFCLYQLNKRK